MAGSDRARITSRQAREGLGQARQLAILPDDLDGGAIQGADQGEVLERARGPRHAWPNGFVERLRGGIVVVYWAGSGVSCGRFSDDTRDGDPLRARFLVAGSARPSS